MRTPRQITLVLSILAALAVTAVIPGEQARAQTGSKAAHADHHHGHHEEGMKSEGLTAQQELKMVSVFSPPSGFVGNMTYDRESGRMWLISLGPPANTKGPSTLYEVDPASGKVLAQASMPFLGVFGPPVYIDGYLYQGIFHESKMYKIAADRANLGKIVKAIPLPTLSDLSLPGEERYKFPFIEFNGVAVTPDKKILIHAADLGEFITLEKETGQILSRVRTLKGLGGIASVPSAKGDYLVLGNYDPDDAAGKAKVRRFVFRAPHPVVPTKRTVVGLFARRPGEKFVIWVLIDPKTGSPLASFENPVSTAYATNISLVKHEKVRGTPYGRFTFLALADEGLVTMEWTPGANLT